MSEQKSDMQGASSYRDAPPIYNSPPSAYAPQPQYQPVPPMAMQMNNTYAYDGRCAQGQHERTTKFGVCGILAAIFCFPFGFICCFLDTERVCARCGVRL